MDCTVIGDEDDQDETPLQSLRDKILDLAVPRSWVAEADNPPGALQVASQRFRCCAASSSEITGRFVALTMKLAKVVILFLVSDLVAKTT